MRTHDYECPVHSGHTLSRLKYAGTTCILTSSEAAILHTVGYQGGKFVFM